MGRSSRSTVVVKKRSWRTATRRVRAWLARCQPKTSRWRRMKPVRVVCVLVGIEAGSNSMFLEQAAQARDHDTWQRLMEQALTGLNCQVMQSTSDEAPG